MELPVGGSILSDEMTMKLRLDFSNFSMFADHARLTELYEGMRAGFESWYAQMPETLRAAVSPLDFFILATVQNGMEARLEIGADFDDDKLRARNAKYDAGIPKLSEFRNNIAYCAERAALGQWLLQTAGIPSVYMSGVNFDEELSDGGEHSWIVLFPDTDHSLIFDIARPQLVGGRRVPSLYMPERTVSSDVFAGKSNAFLPARTLWGDTVRHFGVSDAPKLTDEPANIVRHQVEGIL